MKINRGFTTIELLIVVTIIAIMTTIAVTSFNNSTKTAQFNQNVDQFVAKIREARSLAINSKTVDHEGEQKPPNAYAIFFETTSQPLTYRVFADNNDPETPENHYQFTRDTDEILSNNSLPLEITFKPQVEKVTGNLGSLNRDFYLFYEPPFGDFTPDSTLSSYRNVILNLASECEGCQKSYLINLKSGLLEEI